MEKMNCSMELIFAKWIFFVMLCRISASNPVGMRTERHVQEHERVTLLLFPLPLIRQTFYRIVTSKSC